MNSSLSSPGFKSREHFIQHLQRAQEAIEARRNRNIQEFIARRTARLPSPPDCSDGDDDEGLCPIAFGLANDDPRVRLLGFEVEAPQQRSNRMCSNLSLGEKESDWP